MAQGETFVDVAAVRAVAHRFDDAAHLIDGAARAHLGRLRFDGTTSGRAYIGQGDALRFALHRLGAQLSQWSRASLEIGATLRAGADRYDDADQLAATRIA